MSCAWSEAALHIKCSSGTNLNKRKIQNILPKESSAVRYNITFLYNYVFSTKPLKSIS